eukprot:s5680_g5.t1
MVQPVSSLLLVKHLCTDTDSVERLPRNSEACSQERLQAAFFELCCEYFLNHSQREESLTFVKNPMCCLLEDKAKAGKLTIFPFTDQISKIGLKPAVWRFGIRPRAPACIFPPGCIRQFLICLLADPGLLSHLTVLACLVFRKKELRLYGYAAGNRKTYVLKLDGASWTLDTKDIEETDDGPFVVLRPWSTGLCKVLAKQRRLRPRSQSRPKSLFLDETTEEWASIPARRRLEGKLKAANFNPGQRKRGPGKGQRNRRKRRRKKGKVKRTGQHKLSVVHRMRKYISQVLGKEQAAYRARARFTTPWQSSQIKWELQKDKAPCGYGDYRGGSGPSRAKTHAHAEAAKPKGKGKKKKRLQKQRCRPRPPSPSHCWRMMSQDRHQEGQGQKGKAGRVPPPDSEHRPLPGRRDGDPEDPEGPDSYGKVVTSLFQIACAELRQRYSLPWPSHRRSFLPL